MATATLQAGNWRKFESFCWFDRPQDADGFAIVHTDNRDSDLIDKSNARVIARILDEFPDDAVPQSFSHWACGYVNGYAIRVYDADGELTAAAQAWEEIQAQLADYPILDESDYGELELEEQCEAWSNWARHDFERGIEKRFDCELTATPDQLRTVFDKILESSSACWETDSSGVSIDVSRVVEDVTADDIAEFVEPSPMRVFLDGEIWAHGTYHLGRVTADLYLYASEFAAIESALDNGEESATYYGARLTWQIDQ